jgi:hypothetical protein
MKNYAMSWSNPCIDALMFTNSFQQQEDSSISSHVASFPFFNFGHRIGLDL